jgi:hypothetical protein
MKRGGVAVARGMWETLSLLADLRLSYSRTMKNSLKKVILVLDLRYISGRYRSTLSHTGLQRADTRQVYTIIVHTCFLADRLIPSEA